MRTLQKKVLVGLCVAVMAFVALCATFVYGGSFGVQEQASAAIEGVVTFKISAKPSHLYKVSPYRPFTVMVRCVGVSGVSEGLYGTQMRLRVANPELVEFVEFVPSTEVKQSAELRWTNHEAGYIEMEGSNNGLSAIKSDFDIGGFRFKLKDSVTNIPDKLDFYAENVVTCTYVTVDDVDVPTATYSFYFD